MADLVEIPIIVKDQGLKQAISTVTRLERELTRAVKAIDEGTMSQRRFNQILTSAKQQYKDYAGNAGLATINVNRFVKAQQEATAASKSNSNALSAQIRANQEYYQSLQQASLANKNAAASADVFSARLDSLRGKYNPLYAASKQYEMMVEEINEAHRLGAISAAQFQMAQEQLTQQFATGTGAFAKYNGATQASAKFMNRMGVVTQQAGYQIGDFLVQIQSGTNPLVAFGQQATQLVGVMTLFGGKFILIGSILGILIPLFTALGAVFMRSRREAEETTSSLERMAEALSDIESLSFSSGNSVEISLENVNSAARVTLELFREIAKEQLSIARTEFLGETGIRQALSAFEASVTQQFSAEAMSSVGRTMDEIRKSMSENLTIMGLNVDQAREFDRLLQSVSGTTRDEMAQSFAAVVEQVTEAGLITEETRDIIEQMGNDLGLVAALQEGITDDAEQEVESRRRVTEAILEQVAAYTEVQRSGNDILNDLMAQIALNETILKFGEDSAEVENRRAIQAKEAFEQRLNEENITGELRDRIMEAYDRNVRLTGEVENTTSALFDATNQALLLRDAMQQVANASLSNQDQIRILQAQISAAQRGTSTEAAKAAAQVALELGRAGATIDQIAEAAGRAGAEAEEIEKLRDALSDLTKTSSSAKKGLTDAERAAEELRKTLEGPVVSAIDSFSNAWAEFIMRGFSDFKGFTQAVLNSFKNMIAQMIATAARNRIMLSMGLGGSGFATAASAGQVAGLGSAGFGAIGSFGTGSGLAGLAGGTGFLGGMGNVVGGLASGGLSGAGSAIGTALTGATSSLAGFATAVGAIALPMAAVAAVFSFFSGKTKELNSGLKITVGNMDALVQTFRTVEKSRFWGLSKKIETSLNTASDELANPLVEAVVGIQQSVMDAAAAFGIAGSTFDNFVYQMDISLKGLTEDQKMQKINEELAKMGDEFASLTGHFESMNELLEAANQRMQLQNRLDQLLGNNAAILARQREAELSAMNELNRPLAQAIFQLEDAQAAVQNAFASLRASIDGEKNRLRDSFANIVEGLRERLDVATQAARRSQSVFDMLESALSGRFASSGIGSTFARREGALNFLRGGNFEDEKRLEEALQVIGEPSEDLFASFVDYARDFARTSFTIEEAKKVAQVQLTADEKQVLLLEEQIVKAQSDLEQQLDALDKQFQIEVDQYNALLGIDTSVKSVTEAIGTLRGAIESLAKAQDVAKAAAAAGVGGGSKGGLAQFETDQQFKGFDVLDVGGASGLLEAASLTGIQTTGKTGLQIAQEIANQTGKAIQLDAASRVQQFAMGGYHTGGIRMVGERGPELEATGASRIFSHNQTRNMFRDPELKDAVRSLKEEVAGLRTEQRQIQMDISKYTKRSYDIERKWDVEGLPATRT
jgi:hypothetical protein